MRLRRKLLLGLLGVVLLVPTAVLYWVATTESGLRFVVQRLDVVGPVTLTIDEVSGTLTDGVRIGALRVQHRLSDTRIEEAEGRVQLLPLLLRRHIELPLFTARSVSITLLEDPVERPRRQPRFLPAMVRIDADAVRIDTVALTLKSGRELAFTGLAGGVTVLQEQIRVRDAVVEWEDWHLAGIGRVHAARPYGLDGEIDAVWSPPNQPQWLIATKFDGDLDDLPFTAQVSEPFLADVKGNAVLQSDWQVAGHALASQFDLEPFGGGTALGIMSGELDILVNREGIKATGNVTPPGLQAGAFDVDFHGFYQDKQLDVRPTVIVHPPSGARATVRGTVNIEPGGPRLALSGQWTQLRWPLAATEPAFTSPQGRYSIAGVKPWQLEGAGEVIAAGMSAMPARARGQLGTDSFLIEEGSLQVLGGSASFTGEARWQPAESWQVRGRMTDLDPAQLRADLPGRLSFDFSASGAPFGESGNIDFDFANLTGEVRAQEVEGSGRFARPGGSADWSFRDVRLELGTTRVELDGALGPQPDLTFALQTDDLSVLDPEARGRLTASGRFAGTSTAPLLQLVASGTGFEWQDFKLESLVADLDIDLTSGPGRADGSVALTQLAIGPRTIDTASLAVTGTGERQRLSLAVDAAPLRAGLAAEGALREGLWEGQLTRLTIDQVDRLALRNEAPAPLAFNLQQVELGQMCLMGAGERLCGSARRLAEGTWSASLATDALPLSTFTAGLSQDYEFEGTIDLQGELAGRSGELPTGSVEGQLTQAQVRHRLGSGRDEVLTLGTGSISANATTDAFSVQVALDAEPAGSIRGSLDGERLREDWRDYPIRGSLEAQTDGLTLVDMFVAEIDKATGQLNTRVDIGGTLGTPTLRGMLQLREASIDIYQVNLALRDLALDARFDASSLELTGQSNFGNGIAKFSGNMAWRDGEPVGTLRVEGNDLQIVNVPEALIHASPDLTFKVDGRRIEVSGEVRVPYGRIEPADLTTAVLVSNDEIMVGEPVVDPSQRWTIVSDILLQLGNDVRIETLGLAAALGGALRLRTDESQVTRGQGELTISDGRYAALGRLLDVERGRLIFNNAPLSDPGIDLSAQKVFPDAIAGSVTAGVNVRGSLRAPRMTFFSEPSLPQSQIASLILAGGSIESFGDSQAPGAARNDLLAQGGAILAQRVGSQVGIDDVGIETDRLGDHTSLVVGKYLSPRLYISYGVSLAEAINTLKLRWIISERWTISTEAGQERSADIVFTLKK
ncbi:MAG TPA: translocation/assembly module TamB domain-containing protein [Steroidobacteraceae bacterium]|nr:translocation/assembly module TamB domain-containing protein [Steroidobacteraceae bacterium]